MDDQHATTASQSATEATSDAGPRAGEQVEADLIDGVLVEEVSIDGMCGVY